MLYQVNTHVLPAPLVAPTHSGSRSAHLLQQMGRRRLPGLDDEVGDRFAGLMDFPPALALRQYTEAVHRV